VSGQGWNQDLQQLHKKRKSDMASTAGRPLRKPEGGFFLVEINSVDRQSRLIFSKPATSTITSLLQAWRMPSARAARQQLAFRLLTANRSLRLVWMLG
jgi:hypothetical protein